MNNDAGTISSLRNALAPALLGVFLGGIVEAQALSELQEEDIKPGPEVEMVPLPPPLPNPANPPAVGNRAAPDGGASREPDEAAPDSGAEPDRASDIPVPPISYDIDALPEPVRRTRQLIIDACRRGEIEALRPLLTPSPGETTQLSLGGLDGDPVAFLEDISGDGQGHEILAILQEVLEAGYVVVEPGTENELYVWPYFFAVPLDSLTPPQRVELFRLVTAGDYEDMKSFGAYIFYRAGIRPDGSWAFFVAGD